FSITDLPWSYIAIASIGIIAIVIPVKKKSKDHVPRKRPGRVTYQPITTSAESTDKVPRKKPGRVKYQPITISGKSAETTSESEKRIPDTLHHRDR
ncbi:MAG: hypothetical protein Lokiarch_27600, partial [Candidatus Lokiarchaeum sp. GC14_75]